MLQVIVNGGAAAIRGTELHEKLEEILCSTELVKQLKKKR